VVDVVCEELAGDRTEVTVLIPKREYRRFWHRFLHDRTGMQLANALAAVPHANVTLVPYHLGSVEITDVEWEAFHASKQPHH